MKKTLIINYSRSGTTNLLAKKLAEKLGADVEEIIDKTSRGGALGYIIGGRDAILKKTTLIEPLKKDFSKYELVIIGTPNWAGTITPAIRTVLMQNKKNLKKVAFFQTRGGDNDQKVFEAMQEVLNAKPLATLGMKTKEVRKGENEDKIDDFVKKIKSCK
ncbi:flavodoxin family protein [Candidatus Woesearchaeota archaeon]|nr:flavodoxin family protein [Candidatus Woesearchaeota archaeon]